MPTQRRNRQRKNRRSSQRGGGFDLLSWLGGPKTPTVDATSSVAVPVPASESSVPVPASESSVPVPASESSVPGKKISNRLVDVYNNGTRYGGKPKKSNKKRRSGKKRSNKKR